MAIGEQFASTIEQAANGQEQGWATIYGDLAPRQLAYLVGRGTPNPEVVVGTVFADLAATLRGNPPADERALRMAAFGQTRERAIIAESEAQLSDTADADAAIPRELGAAGHLLGHVGAAARDVLLLRLFGGFTVQDTASVLGFEEEAVEDLQSHGLSELHTGILAWATTQPRHSVQDVLDHAADDAHVPTAEEVDRLVFGQVDASLAHLAPYAIAIDHLRGMVEDLPADVRINHISHASRIARRGVPATPVARQRRRRSPALLLLLLLLLGGGAVMTMGGDDDPVLTDVTARDGSPLPGAPQPAGAPSPAPAPGAPATPGPSPSGSPSGSPSPAPAPASGSPAPAPAPVSGSPAPAPAPAPGPAPAPAPAPAPPPVVAPPAPAPAPAPAPSPAPAPLPPSGKPKPPAPGKPPKK